MDSRFTGVTTAARRVCWTLIRIIVAGRPQMACQDCGECFIGCNTHSKNTMDLTYLWHADRASAEVFSQHRVSRIKPNPWNHPVCPDGYTVHYRDLRWNFPRDGVREQSHRLGRQDGVNGAPPAQQVWLS